MFFRIRHAFDIGDSSAPNALADLPALEGGAESPNSMLQKKNQSVWNVGDAARYLASDKPILIW